MSLFAQVIRELLDGTDFFSRDEWSQFLAVPTQIIDHWTTDEAVPFPFPLRMIVELLRMRGGQAAQRAVEKFDAMAQLPTTLVSPFHRYMGATVADYMNTTLVSIGCDLQKLQRDQQIIALVGQSWTY